jgi:hypothetical protein
VAPPVPGAFRDLGRLIHVWGGGAVLELPAQDVAGDQDAGRTVLGSAGLALVMGHGANLSGRRENALRVLRRPDSPG